MPWQGRRNTGAFLERPLPVARDVEIEHCHRRRSRGTLPRTTRVGPLPRKQSLASREPPVAIIEIEDVGPKLARNRSVSPSLSTSPAVTFAKAW